MRGMDKQRDDETASPIHTVPKKQKHHVTSQLVAIPIDARRFDNSVWLGVSTTDDLAEDLLLMCLPTRQVRSIAGK